MDAYKGVRQESLGGANLILTLFPLSLASEEPVLSPSKGPEGRPVPPARPESYIQRTSRPQSGIGGRTPGAK